MAEPLSGPMETTLRVTLQPVSALATAITVLGDSFLTAIGWLIKVTTGANSEATICGDGEDNWGQIVDIRKRSYSGTWLLTCRIDRYYGADSAWHTAQRINEYAYTGSLALGADVLPSATSKTMKTGGGAGQGYVLALDVPSSGRCLVLE